MDRTLTVVLALAAGLAGGLISRYVAPPVAYAQNRPSVTREVRAQSFTLVDEMDRTVGTFSYEGAGKPNRPDPRIVLRDFRGREIWSADGNALRLLSQEVR